MYRNPFLSGLYLSCSMLITASTFKYAKADFLMNEWNNEQINSGHSLFSTSIQLFSTSQNYSSFGTNTAVPSLSQYSRIQSELTASHGFNSWLSSYARLSWGRYQVSTNSSTTSGTIFGLTNPALGLNARLFEFRKNGRPLELPPSYAIDLQLQGDIPVSSNATAKKNATPFLGDGSVDMTLGLFATAALSQSRSNTFTLVVGGGFQKRSDGFSTALPWSAKIKYSTLNSGLFADIGANGLRSLQTDKNPLSGAGIGAGGSYALNAINPTWTNLCATAGWQLTPKLALSAHFSQTLLGQSTSKNNLMGMTVSYSLEPAQASEHPEFLPAAKYGKSNQGYLSYSLETTIERVNDRLNLLKISKGTQDGIEAGQTFDIFEPNKTQDRLGRAVARAKVTSVKQNEAALNIIEYFQEIWIEEGFVARKLIQ